MCHSLQHVLAYYKKINILLNEAAKLPAFFALLFCDILHTSTLLEIAILVLLINGTVNLLSLALI